MKDEGKTKEQLINELVEMRQRIAELEASEAERKRAEEALRESEEFQRTLLETSPDYIFVLDANSTILRVNRLHPGHREEEVVGQRASMFIPLGYRDAFERAVRQAADTRQLQTVETMVDLPDGRHYILNRLNPVDLAGEEGSVVLIATDITERKRVEEQIKASLREKEVLLQEVNHRVKNNLQALIYLMDMQAETVEAPQALQTLAALQGRTRAMALVHERLYQTEDLARIDFGGYLEDLTANLLYALGGGRDIALRVDAADLFINVNSAIPCGLIVNELVTNALKYAFPEDGDRDRDRDREICVVFESRDGEYVLVVSDNGVGLPPELDWRATESLGLKLVDIWATYQLGGSIELDTRQGTAFTVKFSEW